MEYIQVHNILNVQCVAFKIKRAVKFLGRFEIKVQSGKGVKLTN